MCPLGEEEVEELEVVAVVAQLLQVCISCSFLLFGVHLATISVSSCPAGQSPSVELQHSPICWHLQPVTATQHTEEACCVQRPVVEGYVQG